MNVGVGYAISINQIKNFLGYLKSGRIVDHATLGASVATNARGRVLVDDILDDSDAYRRGLRYGDEIVSFGGRPIHTANGFKNVLGIFPKGWRVPLTYRRDKATSDILVRLSGVHREAELAKLLAHDPDAAPDPEKKNPRDKKRPQPKPGRPEPTPKPGDKPQGKPGMQFHPPKPPMPDVVKAVFTARPGYVNYYFNQQNQDRVWKAATEHGDFAAAVGPWTFGGELLAGGDWQVRLTDEQADIQMPGGQLKIDLTEKDLSRALAPPGSGGMLVALAMWRRMLIQGPAKFGQVQYLGTAPLAGHMELMDVLSAVHQGVECRLMFNPADGQLAALEMYPEEHTDPAEIHFSDYREVQGRLLPHRWEVRYGDSVYNVFECKKIDITTPAGK